MNAVEQSSSYRRWLLQYLAQWVLSAVLFCAALCAALPAVHFHIESIDEQEM